MNRENLKRANEINEAMKRIEAKQHMLADEGKLQVSIKYKGYNPEHVPLSDESMNIVTAIVVNSLESKLKSLQSELEAL